MSKADQIRQVFAATKNVAETARNIGVSYQHAYGVLKRSGLIGFESPSDSSPKPLLETPTLAEGELLSRGFQRFTQWIAVSSNTFTTADPLPRQRGVYAFSVNQRIVYVGIAASGLHNRLKFYVKPSPSQKTSQRLNLRILELLGQGLQVHILIAYPTDFEWHGFRVDGCYGLEAGLIASFDLPWNIRGRKGM